MAFWNELKKSIGGAADYTVKKTGEVTGTAKLRMDIRTLNTRLAKCYEEIGRAYYKCEKGLGENCAEAIDASIAEVDSIKEEIAALRVQLAKLQGCVLCPACNAQISDKSIFCPLCGIKLPEVKAEEPAAGEADAPAEETACETEENGGCDGKDAPAGEETKAE